MVSKPRHPPGGPAAPAPMLTAVLSAGRLRIPSAVWIPFLASRALVWLTGVLAMVVEGEYKPFDPTGITARLGHTINILLAPAVRWDAVWYLYIAQHGYSGRALASFFPLYPLTIGGLSWSTGSAIVVAQSSSRWPPSWPRWPSCIGWWNSTSARGRLWSASGSWRCFRCRFFFSAVYTESLFLALSAGGVIYQARRGHWVWAGLLGALASATRSVGLVLIVPRPSCT